MAVFQPKGGHAASVEKGIPVKQVQEQPFCMEGGDSWRQLFYLSLVLKITCYQHVKGHHFSSLGVIYDRNPAPPYALQFVRLFSEAVTALKSESNHVFPPFFFPFFHFIFSAPQHWHILMAEISLPSQPFPQTWLRFPSVQGTANLRHAFCLGRNVFHTLAKRISLCLCE